MTKQKRLYVAIDRNATARAIRDRPSVLRGQE